MNILSSRLSLRVVLLGVATALATACRTGVPVSDPSLAAARTTRAAECSNCAAWNTPHAPVRLFGNTWYVGVDGLAAVLVTSTSGHVLIDAGLPESAPLVLANIRALGFRAEDVKLIVNSHAHFDHAGGITAVQRATGARVVASPASATVLRRGMSLREDPQYGELLPFPVVTGVTLVGDGDTLRVGPLAMVAHFTAGHMPGGTSWSWRSCDDAGQCHSVVYADSQTPVSADGFLFSRNTAYPSVLADFAHGFAALESLDCDIIVTPHPSASRFWERVAAGTLVNSAGCREYAANARAALARRLSTEAAARE